MAQIMKFWRRQYSKQLASMPATRVRFAPSPTGLLHLGGLRTALYNYMFAKARGGTFLIRIEDTDQSRVVAGAMEKLLNILNWCGLHPDEGPIIGGKYGPYIQSQRVGIYRNKVEELLEKRLAYHCFCSEDRLDLIRREAVRLQQTPRYDNRCRHLSAEDVRARLKDNKPFVVRFMLNPIDMPFNDLVYGPISYDPVQSEGDPIILKSDKFPTYHLANVVDDHLMEITHVLRGVEWQISTPKHILMYQAFGWQTPEFAHLPLIVNSDGTKLSKRQGDLHVEYFKEKGYFAEALLNFLTSIGGGFGKFKGVDIRSLSEMTKQFAMDRMNVNSCRLELERLDAYNQHLLHRKLANEHEENDVIDMVRALVRRTFYDESTCSDKEECMSTEYIRRMLNTFKSRIKLVNDVIQPDFSYVWTSPKTANKSTAELLTNEFAEAVCNHLREIPETHFTKDQLTPSLRLLVETHDADFTCLMKYLRMALSGLKVGPPVGEMLEVLGKDTTLKRIQNFIQMSRSEKILS